MLEYSPFCNNLSESERWMRILAIDTTTEACSAALLNNGNCFSHFEMCPREHVRRILPIIQMVLRQGNTALTELDALAFGRGPGSFTGVRISIGIAQGLALSSIPFTIPMIGVSTLITMAQGAFRQKGATRVLAAISAHMGEVYWAEYTRDAKGFWHGEKTETIRKLDTLNTHLKTLSGKWYMVGSGWKVWPEMEKGSGLTLIEGSTFLPDAKDMLPIACQFLAAGEAVSVERAEPVYLRSKVAWNKPLKQPF